MIYGRNRERAQLRELLDDASAGHGSLVLISGEAGIGKTTLVDDLIHEAEERDCLVLTGGCYDLTTTPPYGPWIEVLREYRPDGDAPSLPTWFGNPEEVQHLGSQAALFEETSRFLRELTTRQNLVIVLEDMHWCDSASLEALRYLARRLNDAALVLIVSYRDDELTRRHDLFQLLPLLVRESRAERIHLNRLDRNAIAHIIRERYDLIDEDTERLTTYVHERSEGNPFFAEELLRGLEEQDQVLRHSGERWNLGSLTRAHVPPLLRSVIEGRLNRLAEETRGLLEIAAVIGQRVAFDLWTEVSGRDEAVLAKAIEDGLSAQLIEELPSRSGIQFRHALVRETLYSGIIGVHLRSWHLQIGEALAGHPDADPDRVAQHLSEAGDPRQVEYLIQAGKRAVRTYAWIAAVERYEQAALILESDPTRTLDRGWLLFDISEILRYSNPRKGFNFAREAQHVGIEQEDAWLAAFARQRAGFHLANMGQMTAGVDQQSAACADIDAGIRAYWCNTDDEKWRRSIQQVPSSMLAMTRYLDAHPTATENPLCSRWGPQVGGLSFLGRLAEARELGEALLPATRWALEHLEFSVHELGYADATAGLGWTYARLGDPIRGKELQTIARATYKDHHHHTMVVNAAGMQIETYELPYGVDLPVGRRVLIEEIDAYRTLASGSLPGNWYSPAESLSHFVDGDWESARLIAEAGIANESLFMRWRDGHRAVLALMDIDRGEYEHARQHILAILPADLDTNLQDTSIQYVQLALVARIRLALDTGDPESATKWLEVFERWLEWSGTIVGQAESQLLWAHYHRAGGELVKAHEHAERAYAHASNPRQPLALIAADRFLGELDVDEEKYEEAVARLEASLELAEKCEAPFEQALTLVVMAERAAKLGEVDEARRLIGRVREICEPLGAKPTLERVDAIEALLPRARRSAEEHPFGLTGREVEVLRLVARGRTDAETAEELFISPRTASQHLRNAYNKLGVSNRAEATRVAVEAGIV